MNINRLIDSDSLNIEQIREIIPLVVGYNDVRLHKNHFHFSAAYTFINFINQHVTRGMTASSLIQESDFEANPTLSSSLKDAFIAYILVKEGYDFKGLVH